MIKILFFFENTTNIRVNIFYELLHCMGIYIIQSYDTCMLFVRVI
jgi:hypothetical protein